VCVYDKHKEARVAQNYSVKLQITKQYIYIYIYIYIKEATRVAINYALKLRPDFAVQVSAEYVRNMCGICTQ
jgi:formaldehyde-activating enzyme involved in methanogenesis